MRPALLSDWLYAAALAAPIGPPATFVTAQTEISPKRIAARVRLAGRAYARVLKLSESHVERGCEDARSRWLGDAIRVAPSAALPVDGASLRVVSLLSNSAVKLLRSEGPEMQLVVDRQQPGRELLRWRFVSLAMPASILIAAAAARLARTAPPTVRLLHESMAPDGPVAQQHLHHAAMLSFEDLWASLRLRALLDPADFQRRLRDRKAWCPGLHRLRNKCMRKRGHGKEQARKFPERSARHMDEWGDLLFSAFIAHGLLGRHAGHLGSLRDCKHGECRTAFAMLKDFREGKAPKRRMGTTPYPWPQDRYHLGRQYREAMAPELFRKSQKHRNELIRRQAAEERAIVTRAFGLLKPEEETSPDWDYEKLLLQYLRVKTALHSILVHPTGEHGLERFLEHFSQIKVYEPLSDRLRPARPREPGLQVAATEYRVAPDAWLDALARDAHVEEAGPGRARAPGQAAWLIHFKREGSDRRMPLYGRTIREMDGQARRIAALLEQTPDRLRQLRGIDICGVEEMQPLWVSAQVLRSLRAASCKIASQRPSLGLRPLRLTLHAGEDFQWLTSGMRAVAEPFQWDLIERGDRIGHGIALTLVPNGWWKRRRGEVIKIKWIDRLQDLAFLATYTEEIAMARDEREKRFATGRTGEEQDWLEKQINRVLRELTLIDMDEATGNPGLVEEAQLFWNAIGQRAGRRMLQRVTEPVGPPHLRWLHRYFWRRSVQTRAKKTCELMVDESSIIERGLLTKARLRLVRELARWQVPIESNPSSNLVVGGLDAMASQDFLAQTTQKKRKPGHETLPWTISTDDPITFATSLADEYAYAWAGMVLREKKAYDPAHARALLDQAAATSMRTRFTVPNVDG